jgi:hypothetical protein
MPNSGAKPQLTKAESARINGAKSRGAVTAEGRRNSANGNLKHGAYSKRLLLDGESQQAYDAFRQSFQKLFQPADPFESECLDAMVAARWRMRRIESINDDSLEALDSSSRTLERLHRTYTRSHKLFTDHRRGFAFTISNPAQPPQNPANQPNMPFRKLAILLVLLALLVKTGQARESFHQPVKTPHSRCAISRTQPSDAPPLPPTLLIPRPYSRGRSIAPWSSLPSKL